VCLGAVLFGLAFAGWAPLTTAGVASTCLGRAATIVGHGVIHGTGHADVIVGSQGADRITGGDGNKKKVKGKTRCVKKKKRKKKKKH
jgi:hypothetical protein